MSYKNLNVSNWNTENVTDMANMFFGCKGPGIIDVSSWNVSKVTSFKQMFQIESILKIEIKCF